jgi:hypothetical protein
MGYYDTGRGRGDAFALLRTGKYATTKHCPTALATKEELDFVIADTTKKGLGSDYWNGYNSVLKERRGEVMAYYRFGKCDDYFNRQKTQDLGKIVDRESEEYEKLISAQTKKQNMIVLGIGAMVIAIGTIFIFKKK